VPAEDESFSMIDLERAIAEERRARILNVTPAETVGTVQLASSVSWLIHGTVLYHYTTSMGLIGILTEKRIRATSLWHMADASELSYARELYRKILFELAREGEYSQLALASLYTVEAALFDDYTLFAACFCRDGDLLSQWREYGGGVGGFAIGMDLAASLDGIDGWLQLQVIYGVDRQRQCLLEFFTRALAILAEDPEPGPGEPWPRLAALQKEAIFLIASLKHPAFEAEQEVRLVQWRHKSFLSGIEWRPTNSMIVPFVEFALEGDDGPHFARPPIVDLVVGPTDDATLTTRSVSLLLEEYAYTFRNSESVRVRRSQAPLRAR